MAKPDPRYFGKLIEVVGEAPAEILFVDDKLENVEGAASIGLKTLHFQKGMVLKDILPSLLS